MSIDLAAFPPDVKLALIAAGEEFSSGDTFEQAGHTIEGLKKYADALIPHGWPLEEGARLEEAWGLLSEAGCGHEHAQKKKKTLGIGLQGANRAGQTVKAQARTVLTATKGTLLRLGKTAAATEVQNALDATAGTDKTGEELAQQLDLLGNALDPDISPDAADASIDRSGPATLKPLRGVAVTLRDVLHKTTASRTQDETHRLAQIEGIIIGICRRALDVAEAASKALGDPAILAAFKLDKLGTPQTKAV